jgi:hypothetical protein
MDKILSLEFTYRSKTYYALVRTKMMGQEKQHHLTIMNGDLEMILYGHHVVIEEDGELRSATEIQHPEVALLKKCVIEALYNYMQANGLLTIHGKNPLNEFILE